MKSRCLITRPLMVATILGAILALAMLSGCGGSGGNACGSAMGWVYTNGTTCIISGSSTPPSGYLPVAGATVLIVGFPDLQVVTDANGRYLLTLIPAGQQTLQVDAPCGIITLQIPIIGGRITYGSGHTEGGS